MAEMRGGGGNTDEMTLRPLLSLGAECDAKHVGPGMTLPGSGSIFAIHWLGNLEQVSAPL